MTFFNRAVFVAGLVWVLGAHAANLPNVNAGVFPGQSTALTVSRSSCEHTTISLSTSDMAVDEVVVDFQTYHAFRLPGEPALFDEGRPTVPSVSRFYRIPNMGSVELIISNADFELIDNIEALPVQTEGNEFHGLMRDDVLYSRDEWYPSNIATISDPMIMRDFRVVQVTLFPVQVNPVTGQARVYHDLDVEIVANDQPGECELLNPRTPSKNWKAIYQTLIPNLEEDALDEVTENPGSYLIICKNTAQALEWADSLYVWKKRCGFDVVIDARTNWTVTSMVTAIQTAYAEWNPPLEFVCLIGDPQWTHGLPTDATDYDHGFALGNDGDDLEDLGVGRLSGSSYVQMATINAKIMAYEREPWTQTAEGEADTMWYHRALLLAGIAHQQPGTYLLHQWGAQQLHNFTAIDCTYIHTYNGNVNQNQLLPYFLGTVGSGISFFFWQGTWVGEMSNGFPNLLAATRKLPVVVAISEGSGSFQSEQSISEAFLVAGTPTAMKGGVCAIGSATFSTHWAPQAAFSGGFYYSVANQGTEAVSLATIAGKLWVAQTYATLPQQVELYARVINLMGEPSLSMWTDVPVVLDVQHPTTLSIGEREVVVTVSRASADEPIADALVVLWKGDESYVRGLTDIDGHVFLPVNINSTGELLLTVTKRNHKPFLFSIPCNETEERVALNSVLIDDDSFDGTQGNADGVFNPGEIVDLSLYLRNYGTAGTATGITVELQSANPLIEVMNGTTTAADLAPGDSALAASPLRIQVSSAMRDGETVTLRLLISTDNNSFTDPLEIECHAGALSYVGHELLGDFGPGQTQNLEITVYNHGEQALAGVVTVLVSRSPFIAVNDGQAALGTILSGEAASNIDDILSVSASAVSYRGFPAPMRILTATESGSLDTLDFTLYVGTAETTDPSGPDAYGYFAYDNTDTSAEFAPVFDYVDISEDLGTELNLNDPGEKTFLSPIYSTARALPFPFTFYGQTCDTITVCSNGWAAFGNQSWNDCFRNFPIPGILAPDAMLAPYWDDLRTSGAALGVWDYFDADSHRYVIQWKAEGALQSIPLEFELILFDETEYPTWDGNGMILFQYLDATDDLPGGTLENPGCTVGIQQPGCLVGLQYLFADEYAPGAADILPGRAILFTTTSIRATGSVTGTIIDAETSLPVPGVDVSLRFTEYHSVTDEQGHYLLEGVLISTYEWVASGERYNSVAISNVVVLQDSITIVNAALLHPEIQLTIDSISIMLPGDPLLVSFDVINDGNGPLDCEITVFLSSDSGEIVPWDSLFSLPVSEIVEDPQINGCEFFGGEWWITGGFGAHGGNYLYRFNPAGVLQSILPQPGSSLSGWFDLATDGQFLFGSDSAAVVGIDATGQVHEVIPSPLNPTRAIAYDPELDHFWVADLVQDLYEINRQGQVLQQFDNPDELSISGLAWHEDDPLGYKLYLFSRHGTEDLRRISRMHPLTGQIMTVVDLPAPADEHAGGCTITHEWNGSTVFAAILEHNANDVLRVYLLDSLISWLEITPEVFSVPGGAERSVLAAVDAVGLRPAIYRATLSLFNAVLDTTLRVPINLDIQAAAAPEPAPGVPAEFALYQNFPNPFNPRTEIAFDLPLASFVTLELYNTLGQRVTTLISEHRPAGRYAVSWDGSALSTGLYLYRIHAGAFVETRKMILLK